MSSEHDAASRTEEATPRRLEEARKQGDVAKSHELAQVFALAGTFAVVAIGGGWLARDMAVRLIPFLAHPDTMNLEGAAGVSIARQAMLIAAPSLCLVLGATMLAGVGGNVIQQGFLFTTAKLRPDLSKLSLTEGFKRVFGLDGLAGFIRSLLKVLLVGAVAWWVVAPHAGELPSLMTKTPIGILIYCASLLRGLMMAVLILLALIAGLDYFWQRQRFAARMRMSKEELKEDFRQSEGDPRVKAKQRQIRLDRARRRMMQAVPKATVVVMNPTHYAVALRYEQGETPAPECVAKGVDAVALKIREVAEEHGVPVIEDPPLARALYGAVEIDEIIPQQHYEAVAKIIGFIFAGKRPGGRARSLRSAMMAG
jgi:flagellar biosynthetic protein FlhB